jgi:hypothetical protein
MRQKQRQPTLFSTKSQLGSQKGAGHFETLGQCRILDG